MTATQKFVRRWLRDKFHPSGEGCDSWSGEGFLSATLHRPVIFGWLRRRSANDKKSNGAKGSPSLSPWEEFERYRCSILGEAQWKRLLVGAGVFLLVFAAGAGLYRFLWPGERAQSPITEYSFAQLQAACPAIPSAQEGPLALLLENLFGATPTITKNWLPQPKPSDGEDAAKRLQALLSCVKAEVQLAEAEDAVKKTTRVEASLISSWVLGPLTAAAIALGIAALLPWTAPFPMLASEVVRVDLEHAKDAAMANKPGEKPAADDPPAPAEPLISNADLFAPGLLNSAIADKRFDGILNGVWMRCLDRVSGEPTDQFVKQIAEGLESVAGGIEERYDAAKEMCKTEWIRKRKERELRELVGDRFQEERDALQVDIEELTAEIDALAKKYPWLAGRNAREKLREVQFPLRHAASLALVRQLAADDGFHYLLEERAQGRRRITRLAPAVLSRFKKPEEKEAKAVPGGLSSGAVLLVLLVGAGSLLTVHLVDDRIEKSSSEIKVELAGAAETPKPPEPFRAGSDSLEDKIKAIADGLTGILEALAAQEKSTPVSNQLVVTLPAAQKGGDGESCKQTSPPWSTGSVVQSCSPIQSTTPSQTPNPGGQGGKLDGWYGNGDGALTALDGDVVHVRFDDCKATPVVDPTCRVKQVDLKYRVGYADDGMVPAGLKADPSTSTGANLVASNPVPANVVAAETTAGASPQAAAKKQAAVVLRTRSFSLTIQMRDGKNWSRDPVNIKATEKGVEDSEMLSLWSNQSVYSPLLNADVMLVRDRRRGVLHWSKSELVLRVTPRPWPAS